MSNIVEGVIEDIRKSKPSQKYPDCCTFSIKINGEYYQVFAGIKRESSFKLGDKVKFSYTEEEFNGMPQYKFKMDTFENLTNPQANAKKGSWGGKPQDAETGIRIANQSQLSNAITILCHNNPDMKVQKVDVLALATELVEWVYTNKPKSAVKPPETTVKNDVSPVESYKHIPDDDQPPY